RTCHLTNHIRQHTYWLIAPLEVQPPSFVLVVLLLIFLCDAFLASEGLNCLNTANRILHQCRKRSRLLLNLLKNRSECAAYSHLNICRNRKHDKHKHGQWQIDGRQQCKRDDYSHQGTTEPCETDDQ